MKAKVRVEALMKRDGETAESEKEKHRCFK